MEGIRHVDIIRLLNERGFAISEYTYRSYLQRYRKKQAAMGNSPAGRAPVSRQREAEDRRPSTMTRAAIRIF